MASKKWDPHKGRWTMRRIVKAKLEAAGPKGIPVKTLAIALRNEGYYIPTVKQLIDMLPSLNLRLGPDGVTVYPKVL